MTDSKHEHEVKLPSRPRPLSPHLTIFKAEYSSMFSIFHRISGVVLSILFLVIGLFTRVLVYNSLEVSTATVSASSLVTSGGDSFLAGLTLGAGLTFIESLVIVVLIVSLSYHLNNGLRHLGWDLGLGVRKELIEKTALYVLCSTLALAGVVLILFYM